MPVSLHPSLASWPVRCVTLSGEISTSPCLSLHYSFSGLMMLHLDMSDWLARYFVYSVAVSSLMMVWQVGTSYNFRFSRTKDIGISVYLCIVVAFFYTNTPLGLGLICQVSENN